MAGILDDAKTDLSKAGSVNTKVGEMSSFLRSHLDNPLGKDDKKPRDPYIHLRFAVQIGQINAAMFTECSALTIETETFEYAEGGLNTYTHKLPTRTKYGNVTLKRGLDETQELYDWYLRVVNGNFERRHISIVLYDVHGKEARKWELMDAYPCKWTGPDLRVDAGAIAVESIEFAHAGLVPTSDRKIKGTASLFGDLMADISSARDTVTAVLDKVDEAQKFAGEVKDGADSALEKSPELADKALDELKEARIAF